MRFFANAQNDKKADCNADSANLLAKTKYFPLDSANLINSQNLHQITLFPLDSADSQNLL